MMAHLVPHDLGGGAEAVIVDEDKILVTTADASICFDRQMVAEMVKLALQIQDGFRGRNGK